MCTRDLARHSLDRSKKSPCADEYSALRGGLSETMEHYWLIASGCRSCMFGTMEHAGSELSRTSATWASLGAAWPEAQLAAWLETYFKTGPSYRWQKQGGGVRSLLKYSTTFFATLERPRLLGLLYTSRFMPNCAMLVRCASCDCAKFAKFETFGCGERGARHLAGGCMP